MSPLTIISDITSEMEDVPIDVQEIVPTLSSFEIVTKAVAYLSVIEVIRMRLVNRALSMHPLSTSNFVTPSGRFAERFRVTNFKIIANVTNTQPEKMSSQLWEELELQNKITSNQDILVKLLRRLLRSKQKDGFTFLIKKYFNSGNMAEVLYNDPELGVPALLTEPSTLTMDTLWNKAIQGKVEFVQAALPTLNPDQCSELEKLCQNPDSLLSMAKAPSDPVTSRRIFDLLTQVCARVEQSFGFIQAQSGMSREYNLPQLQFVLSNLEEGEKVKYHVLWKQRELTNASFDYLHEYLGSSSMPVDHLSFIVEHTKHLVLEHMINSGKYFPKRYSWEQVVEASKIANEPRIIASIIHITTFYGKKTLDAHVTEAIYRAFSRQGCRLVFPESFEIWNGEHIMTFAKGPFSQWLNKLWKRDIKDIVNGDGIEKRLRELGILTINLTES